MTTNEDFSVEPVEEPGQRPDLDRLKDISLMDSFNHELSFMLYPKIDYYSLNWDQTKRDSLRKEVEQKQFYEMLRVPCTYEFPEQDKTLNQFGVQHNRDLEVHIATSVLEHLNLNPKIGDVLVIEDQGYRVTELNPENYFYGSTQSMSFKLYCNKTNTAELPMELRTKYE